MVRSSSEGFDQWAFGDRPTSPRSPWQMEYAERLIGSIRREPPPQIVRCSASATSVTYAYSVYEILQWGPHASIPGEGCTLLARRRSRREILCRPILAGCITNMPGFNLRQAQVASLYTADAVAFPPGSPMVHGQAAIGAMWKSMAEQVSDPKLTTLDVKPLGPSAAREIGTVSLKTKGSTPQEVTVKYVVVWEKVGNDWKLAADIWNDGK